MSDDKQMSGMGVCDTIYASGPVDQVHADHGPGPHRRRPDCSNWQPSPASPTPERPVQNPMARISDYKKTFNEYTGEAIYTHIPSSEHCWLQQPASFALEPASPEGALREALADLKKETDRDEGNYGPFHVRRRDLRSLCALTRQPVQEMKLQELSEKFYRQGPLEETVLLGDNSLTERQNMWDPVMQKALEAFADDGWVVASDEVVPKEYCTFGKQITETCSMLLTATSETPGKEMQRLGYWALYMEGVLIAKFPHLPAAAEALTNL